MSFVSSTNTLTLGNTDNTIINIGTTATNPTINIGVTGDDNPVFIRGLDPLITSNTVGLHILQLIHHLAQQELSVIIYYHLTQQAIYSFNGGILLNLQLEL